MKLNFEFFNHGNYINIKLNVNNKYCEDIINHISKKYNKSIEYINIYENNKILQNKFLNWDLTNNYIIMIENDFINIIIKLKNKTVKLPQLELSTKISEIKNILSIKDDIFFKNNKLNDTYSLEYYKINDNNILTTYQTDVVTSVC